MALRDVPDLADVALLGADLYGEDELADVELIGEVLSGALGDEDIAILDGEDAEELGSLFGSIAHAVSSAAHAVTHPAATVRSVVRTAESVGKTALKAGGKIIRSPITKAIAGGVAIVFPAALPVAGALVLADRAMATAEGLRGTAKQALAMKKAIARTTHQAQHGNPKDPTTVAARKTVEYLATARKVRKQQRKTTPGEAGLFVTGKGRIRRGRFRAA